MSTTKTLGGAPIDWSEMDHLDERTPKTTQRDDRTQAVATRALAVAQENSVSAPSEKKSKRRLPQSDSSTTASSESDYSPKNNPITVSGSTASSSAADNTSPGALRGKRRRIHTVFRAIFPSTPTRPSEYRPPKHMPSPPGKMAVSPEKDSVERVQIENSPTRTEDSSSTPEPSPIERRIDETHTKQALNSMVWEKYEKLAQTLNRDALERTITNELIDWVENTQGRKPFWVEKFHGIDWDRYCILTEEEDNPQGRINYFLRRTVQPKVESSLNQLYKTHIAMIDRAAEKTMRDSVLNP